MSNNKIADLIKKNKGKIIDEYIDKKKLLKENKSKLQQ